MSSPNDGNSERRGTGPPGGEPERGNAGSTRTVSRKPLGAGRHTTGGEGGEAATLARQEGAPAQMALCESVGRKAAGGGDENAARVDAMNEQPVKWEILFLTVIL